MNRWAVAEGKAGAFELAMDAGPSASQPAGLKFRSLLRCSKMQSEEGGGRAHPNHFPMNPPMNPQLASNEPPITTQLPPNYHPITTQLPPNYHPIFLQ